MDTSIKHLISIARRIDEPELSSLPYVTEPKAGDVVGIYSRGSWRVAVVEKVGRKNLTAIYTTEGAISQIKTHGRSPEQLRKEAARFENTDSSQFAEYRERLLALADRVERDGWEELVQTTRKTTPIAETLDLSPTKFDELKAESEEDPEYDAASRPAIARVLDGELAVETDNGPVHFHRVGEPIVEQIQLHSRQLRSFYHSNGCPRCGYITTEWSSVRGDRNWWACRKIKGCGWDSRVDGDPRYELVDSPAWLEREGGK